MDNQTEYAAISETLDKIEQDRSAQGRIQIDPSAILGHQVEVLDSDYDKACSIIGGIESEILAQQKASQQGPQIQIPVVNVNKEVAQTASQIRQRIGSVEIQKSIVSANKEMLSAAKEIGGIVGGAGKELGGMIQEGIAKAKAKKLILPNLSVQDQIHELEGISDGIDQKVFDAEQLGIIRQEIDGIKEIGRALKGVAIDPSQREMLALRDKLVLDVGNKLLNTNN
ncbi:MAG: hypothetical protein KGH71_04385 [Candidatus Micrarchaeota archaeon]|nr:hypothetical protein [Candidatus Micrarchaeota archaeon]